LEDLGGIPLTEANLLKRLIISDLNSRGHLAWNNNTLGVWDQERRCFRKNKDRSAIGTADVICCIRGQYVELEVKTGKDKQSTAQQLHERAVKRSGGKYFMVKDFDSYKQLRQSEGW
jgi:hypothetical protein